jgi:hypothetical protein
MAKVYLPGWSVDPTRSRVPRDAERAGRERCSRATTAAPLRWRLRPASPSRNGRRRRRRCLDAGLQRERCSLRRAHVGAGSMKPFPSMGMPQPVSQLAAGSAPVKRNRWARACCSSACPAVAASHAGQTLLGAPRLVDLRIADHRDVRCGRDAIDEVARHGARRPGPCTSMRT